MANILYLVHRIPFPPNKGDKLRSYHMLRHLAQRHRVFLGSFVDDPRDAMHEPTVRAMCADLYLAKLRPALARLRSLRGLVSGQALSLAYYQDAGLKDWVTRTLEGHAIDVIVVFSSPMAQYAFAPSQRVAPPVVIDFVDVDSAKWTQYGGLRSGPLGWLYRREGARLLDWERLSATRARRSFFVTESEAELFRGLAPESAASVHALGNGVDTDYFSPDAARASPFRPVAMQADRIPIVFTGAMDYWPNIDAVTWFVHDILPRLCRAWPRLCLYIVGAGPPASVLALASAQVTVTGRVDDIRPWLQHAAVVVAPMRVARGVQNKILEAMAMARPVVATKSCVQAIGACHGQELIAASGAHGFAREIDALLRDPLQAAAIGQAARRRVLANGSWSAQLQGIDPHIDGSAPQPRAVRELPCP